MSAIEWKSYDTAPVVWNLEIEAGADPSYHYVLADGIVTGDLYLQKQLKRQKADASRPLAHNNNL